VAGATAIAALGSFLILDEPRTGKTVTTVLGLVERAAAGHEMFPALVVCPAAVVDPWVEHFHAWAPGWRAVAWRGPKRAALYGQADVYVASYDTVRLDVGPKRPLTTLAPRTLVLDEHHKIKNHAAKQSQAVRKLAAKADQTIALSGTPITHHPADLWPTLDCLAPGAWPSRERWVARYCTTVRGDYREEILGLNPATEDEFRLTIEGQQRRVRRDDDHLRGDRRARPVHR
jgi:SNF2 family DNA or RNA helicase